MRYINLRFTFFTYLRKLPGLWLVGRVDRATAFIADSHIPSRLDCTQYLPVSHAALTPRHDGHGRNSGYQGASSCNSHATKQAVVG